MIQRQKIPFRIFLALAALGFALSAAMPAYGFTGPIVPCGGSGQAPCTFCDLGVLVVNLTKFMMENVVIPAAALLIVSGGILILISGPSEERLKLGKDIITKTIVGAVIVLLAWLMVDTAIKVLTVGGRQFNGVAGPWNELTNDACSNL